MMGTRAAAFVGKISNLRENLLRIQNGTMPQPTCLDLANMLKYFCQVLHDFRDFKDIENIPLYANAKRDQNELSKTLPNFDYSGLYKSLTQFVDILPLIQQPSNGFDQMATNLLMLFKCLVAFLDQENMETMPYLVSTLFMSLPQQFHKDILDTLCFNLLPFTIDQRQRNTAQMLNRARDHQRRQLTAAAAAASCSSPAGASASQNKRPFHCIVRIENDDDEDAAERATDDGICMMDETDNKQQVGGLAGSENELDDEDENEYALLSVTSILMITFHYVQEQMHHSQLVECLMKLKNNVFEDLLYVIAYGTTRARCPAVELLFRYWPDICPSQQTERKNNSQASGKLKHVAWLPSKCQNKSCQQLANSSGLATGNDDYSEAVKMCLDFKVSITLGELPPPMLVCLDCVDLIHKQQLEAKAREFSGPAGAPAQVAATGSLDVGDYGNKFLDILLPMERVSKLCENKKCKSNERLAIGTCFDIECANYNNKRPIRYCKACFHSIHEPCESNNYDITLQSHIRHSSTRLGLFDCEQSINNFVESIISLLKEAAPVDKPSKDSERYLRSLMGPMSQFSTDQKDLMSIATEEKQLISQYGIWLMTGLCKNKVDKLSDELLGRLLGMLFQWFHFTACLPDDQAGSALEKLKGECIKGWIMEVKTTRLDVFISCLLPHPIDCSKIGGHWEVWPDTAHQIKEGFKRLLCLVPYDIITDDVWDEIMPFWMECFRHEVPENELSELKILLSKVFDPELSPLGFETKQMYNFISKRFSDSANLNQEQTLYWLQIITMLEIPIPIEFLFQMLRSGVRSLAEIRSQELAQISRCELAKRQVAERKAAKAAAPTKTSKGDSTDEDSTSSASSSTSSECWSAKGGAPSRKAPTLAAADADEEEEDDDDDEVLVDRDASQPQQLSHQERQARARAAFSAKLMQHASQLDAQHNRKLDPPPQQLRQSVSATATPASALSPSTTVAAQLGTAPPAGGQQQLARSSGFLATPQAAKGGQSFACEPKKKGRAKAANRKRRRAPSGERTAETAGASSEQSAKEAEPLDEYLTMSRIDNNLVCYILMMDILLKQLDLQEIGSHRGLDGREAQQAIGLLNSIISTPWLGRHTCCDSLPGASSPQTGAGAGDSAPSQAKCLSPDVRSASSPSTRVSGEQSAQGLPPSAFGHCAQGFEEHDEDSAFETCVFCEIISTFHQLAMALIEFFSPVIEVSICELSQDATNGEFDGKPDYSRIGLDHLGPSPRKGASDCDDGDEENGDEFSFSQSKLRLQQQQDKRNNLASAFPLSPSYFGPVLKPEVLASLPKELQLAYNLLVQFHQFHTPDIVSQLLQMIKLVSLHSQVLSRAAKQNNQFICWCQHNMLINKLWSLCELESSEIARTCVPLLLHCVTLPWGVRLFRDSVERDFRSENWLSRFRAVERVVTIAYFCEPSTIKNSTLLQSTMASAFCFVVRCLDDIEPIVAQRALVSLELMKTSSLKLLLWCLEVQFDYIIVDRPIILRSVFQLYNHLRDRRFLTWEFFLNRFDTTFLEAQIYLQQTGEINSFTMQDLKNTNTKSEIYQKKISRAREALHETHKSRSLSSRFNLLGPFSGGRAAKVSADLPQARKPPTGSSSAATGAAATAPAATGSSSAASTTSYDLLMRQQVDELAKQHAESVKHHQKVGGGGGTSSPMRRVLQHGRSTSSRYQSVAFLTSQSLAKRKNSKFMSNLAAQSVPASMILPDKLNQQHLPNSLIEDGSKLNEIVQENHAFGVVHRICDEDRDTNHSLIFLLMQFFSKPDPSHPQNVKTLTRSHQIVLRHLNILMGYSIARKNFLIPASNLRLLPVFNAFLTSLPKVLDFNYSLGTILLDTCLPVLIYSPAPDQVQFDQLKRPNYSLWLLNPLLRQSWLASVMTFLYKYQFGQAHLRDQVLALMSIVVNTLESHLNYKVLDLVPVGVREPQAAAPEVGPPAGRKSPPSQPSGELAGQQHSTAIQIESQSGKVEAIELQPIATAAVAAETIAPTKQRPSITKAETSDNLNVKQSRASKAQQLGNKDTAIRSGAAKAVASSTGSLATDSPLASAEDRPNEERLLPIGVRQRPTKLVAQGADSSQAERLLPIGQPSAPLPLRPDSPQSGAGAASARPLSPEAAGRPLPGLRANMNLVRSPLGSPASASSQVVAVEAAPSERGAARRAGAAVAMRQHTQSQGGNGSGGDSGATPVHLAAGAASDSSPQTGSGTPSTSRNKTSGGGLAAKQLDSAKQTKPRQPAAGSALAPPATPMQTASFASPTKLNEQLAQLNRHSLVQEFSDKDLSMCLVILETFIHHEPSMAAQMLPNILRLVARFAAPSTASAGSAGGATGSASSSSGFGCTGSSAGGSGSCGPANDSWQTLGSNVHLVGGSMFVARQFIRVALHDLMENNIFHQIFASHFTGFEFYKSMSTALADFADLNQLTPLSKLFEDLNRQKNLPPANSLMTLLENVATYFDCITSDSTTHSQTTWNSFILNWETFLRKLILVLPRYSTSTAAASSFSEAGTALATTSATVGSSSTSGPASAANQASSSANQSPGNSAPGHQSNAAANASSGNQLDGSQANQNNLSGAIAATSGGGAGGPSSAAARLIAQQPEAASGQQQLGPVPSSCSMILLPIMRIILSTFKIPHLATCKTIVDPYSKIISYTVLNSQFKYEHLLEINHNCCRLYTRDREKYLIQRTIAYELVQVLKFRFFILEENLLLLLLFVLQDVGGTLPQKVLTDTLKINKATLNQAESYVTNISECLRQHIADLLDFITDVHAISRINDNLIGSSSKVSSINRDSFGGHVKAAISQYLALEISLSNSDQRTILRYLPWLYNSPSLQQGPREFIDCVSHIRQLSWIILGSLQHSALMGDARHSPSTLLAPLYSSGPSPRAATHLSTASSFGPGAGCQQTGGGGGGANTSALSQQTGTGASSTATAATAAAASAASQQAQQQQQTTTSPLLGCNSPLGSPASCPQISCQPIPIEKNSNVAEHVQVILAGFAEQSKESVLHMSGLFHAFLLCQLWTMYCENICAQHATNSEQYQFCQSTLDDFWAKITPGVLRLVGHSRVMSEMVSTHFLQLIESLIESNSSILIRYLPMWNSVFYSYKRRNKSGNIAIRLQKCMEWQPPDLSEPDVEHNKRRFSNWLEKVQYKMSHIEIQSSQAAPFYLS